MKIALLGYGKMGKAIEKIALQRGHKIVLRVSDTQVYEISKADVAIDFSVPEAAFDNITNCFRNKVPVISGTTGWLERYKEAVELCNRENGRFVYASNFSLGVHLFSELNKQLANLIHPLKNYDVTIEETHHIKKLDAPSGTAISLAEGIIENSSYMDWKLTSNSEVSKHTIPIKAHRIPDVPGTHIVNYKSKIDAIEIKHTAHNRKGFALGAVIAAEWILGKRGVHSMKDVLNLGHIP